MRSKDAHYKEIVEGLKTLHSHFDKDVRSRHINEFCLDFVRSNADKLPKGFNSRLLNSLLVRVDTDSGDDAKGMVTRSIFNLFPELPVNLQTEFLAGIIKQCGKEE